VCGYRDIIITFLSLTLLSYILQQLNEGGTAVGRDQKQTRGFRIDSQMKDIALPISVEVALCYVALVTQIDHDSLYQY
jgi:hypothetical protein